jgi:hypothetical protein
MVSDTIQSCGFEDKSVIEAGIWRASYQETHWPQRILFGVPVWKQQFPVWKKNTLNQDEIGSEFKL